MMDCLVLVERGGAKNIDIVAKGYKDAVANAFQRIRAAYPSEIENYCTSKASAKKKAVTFDQSELQLSLTSVALATSLHHSGVNFVVYDDEDILEKYRSKLESQIASSIKYVCISTTYLWDIDSLKKMIRFFHERDKNIRIILGGQVLKIWGDSVFREIEDVYCFCFGDMDQDFGIIMSDLLNKNEHENLKKKEYENGKPFYVIEKYIDDLDTMFIPDWSLLKKANFNDNYFDNYSLPERIPVEERRGCPNRCAFCSYHTINKHRQKSPKRILKELINIKKLGYKKVYFTGSEFLCPPSKSRELLQLIIDEGLGLDILAYARIDILHNNLDLIDLMAKAGITCLDFGVESGDQRILKNMNKHYDLRTIPDIVDRLRKKGIDVWASFVFGFPGETLETVQNTINFIIRSNFTVLDFHALQVIPGTPLDLNREKYNLKQLGNIWSHPTMSLRDIPAVMRKVFTEVNGRCDSVVRHINDHLGKYFPHKDVSIKTSKAIGACLHKMIYIEFNGVIENKEPQLLEVWNELKKHIDYIPSFLLEK